MAGASKQRLRPPIHGAAIIPTRLTSPMLSPSTHTATDVIRLLNLEPLPHEGGWFRRTGEGAPLPGDASGRRTWSSIFALFTPDGFSALHRLASDEVWCFHAGDPLVSLRLHPAGRGEIVPLGADVMAGERLQDVVRAGVWQGTRLREGGRWALVTCCLLYTSPSPRD